MRALHNAEQVNQKPNNLSTINDEDSDSNPDIVVNQFSKTPTNGNRSTSSVSAPETKKPTKFDSSDDDDDAELENPANMFAKKPSPRAAPAPATVDSSVTVAANSVSPSSDTTSSNNSIASRTSFSADQQPKRPTPPSAPLPSSLASAKPPTTSISASPMKPVVGVSVSASSVSSGFTQSDIDAEVHRKTSIYEERVSQYQDENATLRRELALAEDRIRKLESEQTKRDGADVHRDCYSHEDMKSAIAQGIAPLATKMKKLEAALKTADGRIAELQLELRNETQRTQQLENELANHDESARVLLENREAVQDAKISELTAQKSVLESKLESERAEAQIRIDSLTRVWTEKHDRAMALKAEEMGQIQREITALRNREMRFEQVNKTKYSNDEAKLRMRIAFYEEQVIEAESLTENLRLTYMASNQLLMREVQDLETKLINAHTAISQAAQEKQEIEKHCKVIEEQLKKSVENRAKLNEVVNELTVQLSEKSEFLGKVINERDELQLAVERLNKQIQRYSKY